MLFFPYTTDAPVYHYPIATGGIIAANTIVFFATTFQLYLGNMEFEQFEALSLEFDTINPLQWITANFMHGDALHLLGNMCFLWAFGLVVEGKIGSVKFFGLYMAMAIFFGALMQVPMYFFSGEGIAFGASGVIFAIMMMALLWAPENDVECFYWIFLISGTAEIKIVKLAGTFLALQFVFLGLRGFSMSSEMGHLAGALIGAPVGLLFLRNEWVDCEDWDLISRNDWLQDYPLLCTEKRRQHLQQKELELHDPVTAALETSGSTNVSPAAQLAARSGAAIPKPNKAEASKFSAEPSTKRGFFGGIKPRTTQQQANAAAASQVKFASHPEFNRLSLLLRQAIQSSSVVMAQQHFGKLEKLGIANGLSDTTLFAYVKLLASAKQWLPAMSPLRTIVAHAGPAIANAKLRIAHIQLNVMESPAEAMKTLRQIQFASESASDSQRKVLQSRDKLLAKCKTKLSEGSRD